jgi:Ca2+-binding RTX toxin-like protein
MSKFSHRFGLNDSDDHMAAHYGPFNHSTVVLYGGDGAGKANPGAPGTPGSGVVSAPVTGTSSGLIINVSYDASVSSAPADFKETIAQVVNYFQATFSDPITINISVGYGEAGGSPMSGGAIGQSLTYLSSFSYSKLKNALAADSKTTADASAVASLPGTDPAGTGHYWVSTAEGKALGLISSSTGTDGFVGFSSAAGIFDYNNGDGVGAGQYDFYGVVAHEFSEVMGRILLVGGTVGSSSNSYDPFDLFHFSGSGIRDFSGSKAGYFSIDGGATSLNSFNTYPGGDAGDWAGATIDAYNAYGSSGVVEPVSSVDLTAMDAIGWDAVLPPSVPTPTPTPTVDLTVTNFALNISASGTSVSFQVNNSGTDTAGASIAGVYLSSDGTITTNDTLIVSALTPSLSSGGFALENGSLTFPTNLTPGTYYIGALADSGGVVAETNETNNASGTIPVIVGNDFGNSLNGTSGNDIIFGLDGNDTLTGGSGNDILIGGLGNDHFRFNARTDGVDTIVDFTSGADILDFSRYAFGSHLAIGNGNFGTLRASHFVANSTGPTNSAQKFWYDTNSADPAHFHTLYFDADGSGPGGAIAMAVLGQGVNLTANDIHLV